MEISILLLAAVTLVVAIAVAFWVSTIATQYTGLELLELSCAAARVGDETEVSIRIFNKGSVTATVTGVTVNGEKVDLPIQSVEPGKSNTISFRVSYYSTLEIAVKTAKNSYYCLARVDG